jgi:hypothetical protein
MYVDRWAKHGAVGALLSIAVDPESTDDVFNRPASG